MNLIREAAIAIHDAESRHLGLSIAMTVSHKYVHVTADFGDRQISRTASWEEIEAARMNVLTANVALAVNTITGKAY